MARRLDLLLQLLDDLDGFPRSGRSRNIPNRSPYERGANARIPRRSPIWHPPRGLLSFTGHLEGFMYLRTLPDFYHPAQSPAQGIWTFAPRGGTTRYSASDRRVGDIHFTFCPHNPRELVFFICIRRGQRLEWRRGRRGSPHPIYASHVLYQQGRLAPRWVLAETFNAYYRAFRGNFM